MKPARNLPRHPLTAAERTAQLLRSRWSPPVNTGPLQVKRTTGINASI